MSTGRLQSLMVGILQTEEHSHTTFLSGYRDVEVPTAMVLGAIREKENPKNDDDIRR